jgi:hypothetical protein
VRPCFQGCVKNEPFYDCGFLVGLEVALVVHGFYYWIAAAMLPRTNRLLLVPKKGAD